MAPSRARAPWLAPTLALASLGLGGCSAHVEDVADASGAATRGLVTVERASTDGTTRTSVSARFMRVVPSADVAVADKLVGSTFEVPAVGRCAAIKGDVAADAVAPAPGTTSIDLLDVGDVSLAAGPTEPSMTLAARAFPDLGDVVSGVFYTSRDAATELPGSARYVVRGSGSASMDRFAIEAEAPAALEDVRVGDAPLGELTAVEEGLGANVRWSTPASARVDDVVVVDVTAPGGSGARCAFADAGRGVLPASALAAAAAGTGTDGRATMTVHRVRREAFTAPGLDGGEIRFDLAVSGHVTFARALRP
jgi:hypothetical protein